MSRAVTPAFPAAADDGATLGESILPLEAPPRSRRHAWILRRVAIGIVTIFLLSIIIFAATQALPGNAARAILGHSATDARVSILSHQLGLDRPVVTQYMDWVSSIFTGHLGTSLVAHESVSKLIGSAVVNSLILVSISALVTAVLAVVLGVYAAARRDRWFDHGFNGFALIFTAVPEFVVGLLLVILFATTVFTVLPAVSLIAPGSNPLSHLNVFVLPVLTLVLATVPYIARLVRGSMIDVLESDYIEMARLKGLSERRILFRHALPNALIPAIQGMAVVLGYMAGGIVVVEFVFGFPGLGSALIDAINTRDIPTIQAIGLLLSSVYVVVNLVADILVVYVTPRLRTAES